MRPSPFPKCVCWRRSQRNAVLNPIALDVGEEIFRATHHPSLIDWDGPATPSDVSRRERKFLEDFLDPTCSHVFDVAVGDSGTGKSHFIRWLDQEIRRRADTGYHSVLIPRSSANLADVLRKILEGFHGEATDRILGELSAHRKLAASEARNRVLDEFALALEAASAPVSDSQAYVRGALPAMVRDGEIRKHLCERPVGIVSRIANHVMGVRYTDAPTPLRWQPDDLVLPAAITARAGHEASALANELRADDELRKETCGVLEAAQPQALAALLRFRPGDLKRAMVELRKSLLARKQELILLLEDLSISEGVDAELVEALLVRTHDSGEELCVLRSIIGLTPDDYHRMRENILGRVHRTLRFDVDASQDGEVLEAFAARYLNATRLDDDSLSKWHARRTNEPPPSACETCDNIKECHESFGSWGGYGLYPLTPTSLRRLYQKVAGDEHRAKAFNPRTLLRKVLDKVLEDAETSIPRGDFPSASLVAQFKLGSTSGELELDLKASLSARAPHALRLYEVYSPNPSTKMPELKREIASALGLDLPHGGPKKPDKKDDRETEREEKQPSSPSLGPDEFDSWLRQGSVTDTQVNKWRSLVHDAVCACIDWDVERLAWLKAEFKPSVIRVDGQTTSTPTVLLEVGRTPEIAATLRWLSMLPAKRNVQAATLSLVRAQIDEWTTTVRAALEGLCPRFGSEKALDLTIRALALTAYLRGTVPRSAGDSQLLDYALSPWVGIDASGRSGDWQALLRQIGQSAGKGQTKCSRAQAFVAYILSCTKGARAGAMIDPSPVLDTLRDIRLRPACPWEIPPSEEWGFLRPVGEFVHEVARSWNAALLAETTEAEVWEKDVRSRLGDDHLEDVLRCALEALDAAAAVGQGNVKLRKTVEELSEKPLKGCMNTVHTAVHSEDDAARLNALGLLERPLMAEIQTTLEGVGESLQKVEEELRKRVQEAHREDQEAMRLQLAKHVDRLRAFFAGIRQKDASRG